MEGVGDAEDVASGEPDQMALAAIDLGSGELRRVDTLVRIFLPW